MEVEDFRSKCCDKKAGTFLTLPYIVFNA